MFRFSCFNAHVQSNRPKKTVQPSTEAMVMALQDGSRNKVSKDSSIPTSLNPSLSNLLNVTENHSDLESSDRVCRSEDLNSKSSFECDTEVHQTRRLRKSQSLGSGLNQEGSLYTDNITKGDRDLRFSCNGSKNCNESTISACRKDHDTNLIDQCEKTPNSVFQVSSGLANDGSIFSVGDPTHLDNDTREVSDTPRSSELAGEFVDRTPAPETPSVMKSRSLPNVRASELHYENIAIKHESSKSRSSEDLHALGMRKKEVFINESIDQSRGDQGENNMGITEENHMDSYLDDGFDSYMLSGVAKDWVMPDLDTISEVKTLQGDSVDCSGPSKDFKIKRIEDWVTDLQHCGPPLEETDELQESNDPLVDVNTINSVTAVGVDRKVAPAMEAAKRYISSLSANATAAQLANHGLVVIPFLSAFVSLKVLNLSGNAIVRITAGALPRGLHILNLSRNNISTIEGLRELTRLRVLDLSYNRILRIGHGLASCASLKELYLAGNKISEVEGLHRLLKLTILDLRFNKISTTKCLGLLAANYNSLQAISLEGNPAQKNVGDEQLKKYLLGLLPHLVYYNRQPMKVSSLKDSAERSVRLGMNSHQFDRGLRSDRKTSRKGSHGVAASRRSSTSSSHAHRITTLDLPKPSKGKQSYLPPIGTKVSTHNRVLSLSSQSSIRKSRSEGTLGVF